MDFVNKIMNVVFAPAGLLFLSFIAAPYYFLKSLCSFSPRSSSENVRDKVVLVTGASFGIGKQISYQYAKKGASLALVARTEQSLNDVADRARQLGSPDVVAIPADVSRADECKRFVDEAVGHFGRLDHLVNKAEILCISMFEEATDITSLSPVMVEVGQVPVAYAEDCAKAIVCGACRGKRCVTVPSWFKVFFLCRLLFPEFVEWCYRVLYIKRPSSSQEHPYQ